MENQTQTQQIQPQVVAGKLSRLATLLADLKRAQEERNTHYYEKVSLGVSGMGVYETLNFECGNGYAVEFHTDDVYLFLKGPNGGRMIMRHGVAYIGEILEVPVECWDKLIKNLEDLIRKKVDEIEHLVRAYHTFKATL